MNARSRVLALVLAVALVFGMMPVTAMAEGFTRSATWQENLFSDVTQEDWFYENVKGLYELGLMIGYGNGLFQPENSISIAETLTVAARIHAISATGEEDFVQEEPWYQVYADYALEAGLIDEAAEDFERQATRLEFAHILARTMPAEDLAPINDIPDGSIPDLEEDAAVYMLYRAGVLMGDDEAGTFRPDSDIKRSEVAAIVTRMILPELRHREEGAEADTETTPTETEPQETTEPEVTEPEVTEPEVTEPEVTEPEVTEPEVTEPEVTEPEVTEPEVTEPEVTEPEVTEPEVTEPDNSVSVSADVELDENGTVKTEVALDGTDAKATVPAGVAAQEGAQTLTLTVTELESTTGNITLEGSETLSSYDVHIEGVSGDNQVPILVELGMALEPGFNLGNLTLYHVEAGETNPMTQVMTLAEVDAHNEFYYDPATGVLTMALATFSEIAVVSDEPKAWGGYYNYEWYNADAAELTIANADQLAAFGAIVGGMDGQNQDSFSGKTVKLVANINLGYGVEGHTYTIFHPIGYYYTDDKNADGTAGDYYSTVNSFNGTFDGNGHTIANFYQNTWEIKGDYDGNYYSDAMGLFGYVVNGTVKNLTVDNFSSDGEFTPTGVIAAYAVNSTFENIAITNCNPRVYNTGNGGIVGIGGNNDDPDTYKLTFNNITIDNTNKITALWGSWDVACGGLVGMFRGAGHVYMTNCHVAAQIDVYNDVCGNYQYYWYRYSGMMVGTNKNMTTDDNGYTVPETAKFHAENCTVHFGDWNDYYYCELVANSLASYTHDHQFSRLQVISSLDEIRSGDTWTATGNFLLIEEDTKTCYHIVNKDGVLTQHLHTDAGEETVDGKTVLKEDKQIVYLPFNQLFTGYGWGVKHIPVYNGENYAFDGITILDREIAKSEVKFATKFTGDFLYRVGNQNTVTLSSLFAPAAKLDADGNVITDGNGETVYWDINDSGVYVTIDKVDEKTNVSGTFTPSTTEYWYDGTVKFSGTGPVKVTIQDYDYCTPTVLYLEVVDAKNTTTAASATANNVVLLNNTSGTFTVSNGYTFYGNGFTVTLPTTSVAYKGDGFAGYISLGAASDGTGGNGGNLDNVQIVGPVYPETYIYRTQAEITNSSDPDYGDGYNMRYFYNSVIVYGGNCTISNCYISGSRTAVYVKGESNVTIDNSTISGGSYANIEVAAAVPVTLKNLTTVQKEVTDSYGQGKSMIGMGVVVSNSGAIITIEGELNQYNWVTEAQWDAMIPSAYASQFPDLFGNSYTTYQHTYNGVTYVNLAFVFACTWDYNTQIVDNRTNTDLTYAQADVSIAGTNGGVYSITNATLNDALYNAPAYSATTQGVFSPKAKFDYTTKNNEPETSGSNVYCYYNTAEGKYLISFDKGSSRAWEYDILTVTKGNNTLSYSVSVSGDAVVNSDNTITFCTAGDYTVTYTYTDTLNYALSNGEISTYSVDYEQHVYVTIYVVEPEADPSTFAFGSNGYTSVTAGGLNYVMPNVTTTSAPTKSSNVVTGSGIGSTTVDGETIYYPIIGMHKVGNSWGYYNYFSIFEAVTITDANGTTYNTSTTSLPSNLTVIGGFILNSSGTVLTAESANGTAIFNYSTGKTITTKSVTVEGESVGLCYYPDSSFSSSTSARDEQTIVAKYCYTDTNGKSYYYYIGYWCAQGSNGIQSSDGCFAEGTLITLADGTQRPIEQISYEDELLAWDFNTGAYTVTTPSLIESHEAGEYRIINLKFTDGTVVRVIVDHGFFDVEENNFVFIDEENVESYIGHDFVKVSDNGTYESAALIGYEVTVETVSYYTIQTAIYNNCIAENMFTLTSPSDMIGNDGWFDYFEIGEGMKYDEEKKQADIEKYGLYTYEDFAEYITYEQFIAFNGPYLKVLVGKGVVTYEQIIELIGMYVI